MRKEYANWNEYESKNSNMQHEMNRIHRRKAKIMVKGKEKNVLTFLSERAKDLPIMEDRKTHEPVNHVTNLRQVYMSHGVEGVNEYVKRVKAVIERDTSPKFNIRTKGWLLIKWFKLMNWMRR